MFKVFGAMNDTKTDYNSKTNTTSLPKTNTTLNDNLQKNISNNQPIFFT